MNRRHANLHQRLDQIADQTIHSKPSYRRIKRFLALAALLGNAVLIVSFAQAASVRILPLQVSTSPANGDLNPYGLVEVPSGLPEGSIRVGRLLVSNFNDSGNIQGKGTTIVAVNPANGKVELFFQGTPGTPLGIFQRAHRSHCGIRLRWFGSHQRPWRHDS
jgi:hypothetical protein